ncbi:MAG TPA: GIY-YIG nuclease family protein [Polyangiales bacterium]
MSYWLFAALAAAVLAVLVYRIRVVTRAEHSWKRRALGVEQELATLNAQRHLLADAETHARALTEEAQRYAKRVHLETDRECAAIRKAAAAYVREADATLAEADQAAKTLTARAEEQAQQIAGEALRAKASALQLDATIEALKNSVEGYGERYLAPARAALDQLADDAGFSQAGERLKRARERTRKLVESGGAVGSDEGSTRLGQVAARFALDAFNGRVDSILAEVGQTDFGALQQKLRDAALLVNRNAEELGATHIQPAYVEARLNELRCAVALSELRRRELEAQRRFAERLRHQELEQRELEQAVTQASQERTALRSAIEEMRRGAGGQSREERVVCKERLAELHTMMIASDERRRRAMALLQKPKAGALYVVSNRGSFGDNVYKIGTTRRHDPHDFVRELGDASVPFPFDVHALIYADDVETLEKELHRRLLAYRINRANPHKTFFGVGLEQIRAVLEELGVHNVTWTVSAAQHEYRESLALSEEALVESWTVEQERSQSMRVPAPLRDEPSQSRRIAAPRSGAKDLAS